jgi:type IV secretory pathway TrbD component
MIEIFGDDLPPTMTVGELRRSLLERDDLVAAPSTIALVRGHWGHRWMAEHDPVLTDVLMARISTRHGGSHAS